MSRDGETTTTVEKILTTLSEFLTTAAKTASTAASTVASTAASTVASTISEATTRASTTTTSPTTTTNSTSEDPTPEKNAEGGGNMELLALLALGVFVIGAAYAARAAYIRRTYRVAPTHAEAVELEEIIIGGGLTQAQLAALQAEGALAVGSNLTQAQLAALSAEAGINPAGTAAGGLSQAQLAALNAELTVGGIAGASETDNLEVEEYFDASSEELPSRSPSPTYSDPLQNPNLRRGGSNSFDV